MHHLSYDDLKIDAYVKMALAIGAVLVTSYFFNRALNQTAEAYRNLKEVRECVG